MIQSQSSRASALEKARVRGQLALRPGNAGSLGRDPAGWGQEGGRDGYRDFFSVVLNSAPKDYYFLHLQNIVLELETN